MHILDGKTVLVTGATGLIRSNLCYEILNKSTATVYERGSSGEAYNISSAGEKDNFAAADEMAGVIADIVNKEKLSEKSVGVKYLSEADSRQPGIILLQR